MQEVFFVLDLIKDPAIFQKAREDRRFIMWEMQNGDTIYLFIISNDKNKQNDLLYENHLFFFVLRGHNFEH